MFHIHELNTKTRILNSASNLSESLLLTLGELFLSPLFLPENSLLINQWHHKTKLLLQR